MRAFSLMAVLFVREFKPVTGEARRRGAGCAKARKVATVDSTGGVKNPRLHFELRRGRKPTAHRKYLRRA